MSTTDTGPPRRRAFPHLKPLTDDQYAQQHADAIWTDVTSTWYGPADLRRHHQPVNDRPAWRFPYCDRVYVAHRPPVGNRWHVSLWLAPFTDDATGLPHDATTAAAVHGTPLVLGKTTRQHAVRGLALALVGSKCDHGYTRGRDSCPGCDVLDDLYDDLP